MSTSVVAPRANESTTRRTLPPVLEVEGLSKRFGTFLALDDVSLRVEPGSVHALLGENGAGKSTLVKCVMGYQAPDGGRIRLGARDVAPRTPRDAQALGIGMVYQHFTLVPNMTVCENLVLSRPRIPYVVDWTKERAALASFLLELRAAAHGRAWSDSPLPDGPHNVRSAPQVENTG